MFLRFPLKLNASLTLPTSKSLCARALVMGKSGIHRAYETGKGSIVLRARTEIEETKSGRERIVVTEFPYMVNKTKVHEHIVRSHLDCP